MGRRPNGWGGGETTALDEIGGWQWRGGEGESVAREEGKGREGRGEENGREVSGRDKIERQ